MIKKNLVTLIMILLIALTIVIVLVLREQGKLIATTSIYRMIFQGETLKTQPATINLGGRVGGQIKSLIEGLK